MSTLKPGWRHSDVPSQVPESVRRALQGSQQPPEPAPSRPSGLNAGWGAGDIPSQVPESVRQMLAQSQSPHEATTSSPNGDLCELLIVGGTIVDGTGAEPYVGDVAVLDGAISAIARAPASLARMRAMRTVDASGHIVTTGFVDIHTHYDGQITWDPYLSPSTQHGVTTVMFGNWSVRERRQPMRAPCRA